MESQQNTGPPRGPLSQAPIALRPDLTYFNRLSELGGRLSKAAAENQDWKVMECLARIYRNLNVHV